MTPTLPLERIRKSIRFGTVTASPVPYTLLILILVSSTIIDINY